jgi:hypothetical protein
VRSILSQQNDFRIAITTAFDLPANDTWTYHATAAVTLPQVAQALAAGDANGLHSWYVDSEGKDRGERPTRPDYEAYLGLFDPSAKAPGKALKGFQSNAKKGSIKAGVAEWLVGRRFVDETETEALSWPKWKKEKGEWANPYADFLGWVCKELEWCGPDEHVAKRGASHHVLPVLMHHFGCVCPSYEALGMVAGLAKAKGKRGTRKRVLDVGSGNGYWSLMLRGEPFGLEVVPIDNLQSRWRTTWVEDTLVVDAVQWLKKRPVEIQKDDILLMVYPITAEEFTANAIRAFKGEVVCVAGTQNGSGYTGFRGEMVDQWFAREMSEWTLVARVPLMSFPGKDDAFFVFRRKAEAVVAS